MGGSDLLALRLLGEPEAELAGSPVVVDTRKAIAILTYLAVEGPAARDTLAALLWPEAPPDRARATLRRTLSALRAGIGKDHLEADRDRVAVAGLVDVDIRRFHEELEATRAHDHEPGDVCAACIPHLTRAAQLYRGDFLQGFAVADAPEFEDWVRTVGEGIRLRAGEALNRLAIARAAVGDYAGATAAVRRWLDLDALHEPAHRLLMLLHAWAGDRPGAMSAYRDLVSLFDRELGVPPLDETTELYEAILDEDLPPAPGERRRPRAHPARREPAPAELLDREEEVLALRRALADSSESGSVLVLSGASWMGKTRLVEELAATASAQGRTVLVGRATRVEELVPYAAVSPIVRQGVATISESDLELPGWVSDELGRIIPELAGRADPGADPLGDLRFLEAVQQLLELVTSVRPVLITVDDTQWLDAASTRLLGYIASRLRMLPVLCVLSVHSDATLRDDVTDLVALASEAVILQPLRPDQVGDRVRGDRAIEIIAATGGIPLLVRQALEHPESEELAPGISRYVQDRLRGLSDLGRQVLAAAAVLGTARDAAVLRDTSGRTEDEVVTAVEELLSAGLLRELPGEEGIGFAMEAAERLVYDTTSLIRRRLLHKRAAHALEGLPRAGADARIAATIASHHREAGSLEAAGWFRLAGDLARNAYAQAAARSMYQTALALGGEDAGRLHLALGELAMAEGDYETALVELRSAASQTDGETLSVVEHRMGEVGRLLGRFALAEQSFARAEASHPSPTSLYADWALLHHRLGSVDAALRMAEKALDAATDEASETRSRAHNVVAIVAPDPIRAEEHIDLALDLAGDSPPERTAALNTKARILAEGGDVDRAIDLVSEAVDLAAATGHRHREAALRNHLADLHHRAGHAEQAREALTGAVTIFADLDTEAREPEIWLLSQW